jgi:hypothetical protein
MRRYWKWGAAVSAVVVVGLYFRVPPSHTVILYNTSGQCLSGIEVSLDGATKSVRTKDLCDGEAVQIRLRGFGDTPYVLSADRDGQPVVLGECEDSEASFFGIGEIIEIKPDGLRCGYLGLHS